MLHNCHADGMCVDTIGMFNCTCLPGYSGNGTFCENGKPLNNEVDLLVLTFCSKIRKSFFKKPPPPPPTPAHPKKEKLNESSQECCDVHGGIYILYSATFCSKYANPSSKSHPPPPRAPPQKREIKRIFTRVLRCPRWNLYIVFCRLFNFLLSFLAVCMPLMPATTLSLSTKRLLSKPVAKSPPDCVRCFENDQKLFPKTAQQHTTQRFFTGHILTS